MSLKIIFLMGEESGDYWFYLCIFFYGEEEMVGQRGGVFVMYIG